MDMQDEKREGWGTVDTWLSRMGKTTARNHRIRFNVWMRWMAEKGGGFAGMAPDELVEYQKNTDNGTRFEILDVVQRYVNDLEDVRLNTKKGYYSTVRSFFAHNRAELPRDPGFIIRSEIEPVEGTLTISEIRDVCLGSKPLYRAIFLSMFQGGMGLAEFEHWNTHGLEQLRAQLDQEIIKIDLPGRKKNRNHRPFYTLIGGDAVDAIRDYMRIRPQGGEAIFLNQFEEPVSGKALSVYWIRHLIKAGYIVPSKGKKGATRYGKNPHEMRDVFRSQWEKGPAKGSVAEFMMGHQVDPLFYNKAHRDVDWVRREYRSALPMLQIMSSPRPFGRVDLEEVDRLDDEVERLRGELATANRRLESMTPIGAEVANLLKDPIVVETLKTIAANGKPQAVIS